jgi:GNAT superfamily N-acetyltransferase
MKTTIPGAPAIAGLSFRYFSGERDYTLMAEIYRLAMTADQVAFTVNADEMAFGFSPSAGYDPYSQLVIAEVAGAPAAYASARYAPQSDGSQVYRVLGLVVPAWRRQGLGRALLRHNEALARQLATRQEATAPVYEAFAYATETGAVALLTREGYVPVHHGYLMVRPHLEEIPDAPLPPGVEVRAVQPEHYRLIWEADQEAFAGSWGMPAPDEDAYEKWLSDPFFDPLLWRIAWAGDQVVGQVRSFIVAAENEAQRRLRGYTESISVRKGWLRQGLATALLCQSLHAVKAAGMTEAALNVDANHPDHALDLYERCGFRVEQRMAVYRKPMVPVGQEPDTRPSAPASAT